MPIILHFSSLIPKMSIFTLAIVCYHHIQFTLIHGPNITGSYVVLFFTAWTILLLPDTSTTELHFLFGPTASFFLKLLKIALHSSPVTYWAPSDLGASSFSIMSSAISYCSWSSLGNNTGVGCHFLLQWIRSCQNSSLWLVSLGWLCKAWFMASLSYKSPFAMTRLWSMKGMFFTSQHYLLYECFTIWTKKIQKCNIWIQPIAV